MTTQPSSPDQTRNDTPTSSTKTPTSIPRPMTNTLIQTPAQLSSWRHRLFTLDTPLLLSPAEYNILWPLVANIWLAQKRTPYRHSATGHRTVYLCRAGKAVRPTPKDQLPPDKKRRNRKVRSNPVECKATMKYTPLEDGRHLFERRGVAHANHGVIDSDKVKKPREEFGDLKREMGLDCIALGISAGTDTNEEDDERDLIAVEESAPAMLRPLLRPVNGKKGDPPAQAPQAPQTPAALQYPQQPGQMLPRPPPTPQAAQIQQTPQTQEAYNVPPGALSHAQNRSQFPTYAKSTSTTHVALTPSPLPVANLMNWAKHPSAGAVLMFMGTTRAFSRPEGAYIAAPSPTTNGGASGGVNGSRPGMSNGGGGSTSMTNGHAHTVIPPNPYANNPAPAQNQATPVPENLYQGGYAPISSLTYTAYGPLALKTLHSIATTTLASPPSAFSSDSNSNSTSHNHTQPTNHQNQTPNTPTQPAPAPAPPPQTLPATNLLKIAIAHRLGAVPIGEESVVVVVSGVHRGECFRAGEYVLEEVKRRAEVWKFETFVSEAGGAGGAGSRGGGEAAWGGWRINLVDGGGRG